MFEIGNSLREARLRQNLELTEAELSTKIRSKYLRALEDEQFALLPAQTYVKGFLRTYAEWLGLDGQLYVDEYNSRYVTGEDEVPYRPRRTRSRPPRRSDSKAVAYALTGIGVVTALVIVAWRFGSPGEQPALPNLGTSQQSTTRKAAAPSIVLRAVGGDSLVTVRTGGGKQVFQGTIESGRAEHFTSKRLWVSARPPANLRVTINGKRVRTPRGGTAQELIVTAKGVSVAPGA